MKSRIKKKRAKMKIVSIDGVILTRKELFELYRNQIISTFTIPRLYAAVLDPDSDTCIMIKSTNIKRAAKYTIKNRSKIRHRFSYQRFARQLKPKEDFVYHGKPISNVSTKKTNVPAYCCVKSNKES